MKPLVLLAVAILTGCASLDANQCANAYDLGFRDAIFGLQRQENTYSSQCGRLDVARYAQGWQEGKYEADRRRSESHD